MRKMAIFKATLFKEVHYNETQNPVGQSFQTQDAIPKMRV